MTMASRYHSWCGLPQDGRQVTPMSNFPQFIPGSSNALYPGQTFPGFNLRTHFPYHGAPGHQQPLYGFTSPHMHPVSTYPESQLTHETSPDRLETSAECNPETGSHQVQGHIVCDYSDDDSKLDDDSNAGDDLNVDDEEYEPLSRSNPDVGSVSDVVRQSDESTNDKEPVNNKGESSKYPDYCRTITVKDASGQFKELVFPKALDLDRPKRARTTFSPDQLVTLEREFQKNQYLVGRERTDLAQRLGLSETQVKVWFQNRRTKYKRDKCREADEETVRAESSAACSILRILQDRGRPPGITSHSVIMSRGHTAVPSQPGILTLGPATHTQLGPATHIPLGPATHTQLGPATHTSLGRSVPTSEAITHGSRNSEEMVPCLRNTPVSSMVAGLGANISFLS